MSSQENWDDTHYDLGDDALTPEEHDEFNIGWRRLMGHHHPIPYLPIGIVVVLILVSAFACQGSL